MMLFVCLLIYADYYLVEHPFRSDTNIYLVDNENGHWCMIMPFSDGPKAYRIKGVSLRTSMGYISFSHRYNSYMLALLPDLEDDEDSFFVSSDNAENLCINAE